jgi:HlyD family secretion protein
MRSKYWIAETVLVLLAGGAAYWLLSKPSGAQVMFRTEPVTRGELVATVGGTGTLEPEDVIDVGTQVAGLIKEFGNGTDGKKIDYGSPVAAGTILARIDDSLYAAKVEQSRVLRSSAKQPLIQANAKVDEAVANTNKARANLKQAQARDKQNTRDWVRAKNVKATNSLSDQEYDMALGEYELNQAGITVSEAEVSQMLATEAEVRAAVGDTKASVATAEAVLRQDEINLGYCVIKSDVAGIIIDRRVTIGQTVQSSFNTPSLFLIAKDMKRMKVWASVNESDIGQIRVVQPVSFTVDAYPKHNFKGTVVRIQLNATNTQNVVVYTVEVTTENPTGELLPYMTANLKFAVDRRSDALLIPNAALRYRPVATLISTAAVASPIGNEKEKPNTGIVYVQDGGKLRAVSVQLGLTDGALTEVVGGDLSALQS